MTIGITELPPEGMQLGGVALAGDTARGTRTTEGLSLLFTAAGITVQGPQPQIERLLVWSGLDSASCHEKIVLPDGRNAAVMELTSGGQSIKFLLPTDTVSPGQAAYLDQALPSWLARYRGSDEPLTSSHRDVSAEGERELGAVATERRPPPPPPTPPTPSTAPSPSSASPSPAPKPGAAPAGSATAVTGAVNGSGGVAAAATPSPSSADPPPPPTPNAGPPPPVPPPVPPPPSMPGTATWVLSVDPMPEGTAWDNPPIGEDLAQEPLPTKKRRGWRKAKAVAPPLAAATTATAVAAATAAPGAPTVGAPTASPPTGSAPSPTAPSQAGPAPAPATPAVAPPDKPSTPPPPPPRVPAPAQTANGRSEPAGSSRPVEAPPTPVGRDADDGAPAEPVLTGQDEGERRPRRRSRLVVLGAALLLVIGAIAYFAASRNNNTSTPKSSSPPGSTSVPPTGSSSDSSLVSSVNLRLTDLPAGWTQTSTAAPLHLPVANSTVESQATQALASCVGVPVTTAAGLFAEGTLPGQTAVAVSPTFSDAADPGIQMHSMTTALATASQAGVYAAPFESPNFATCYGQFERTVAAAAIPGAVATLQLVTLPQPSGVKSFAFITTVTSSQGTEQFGQAFLIGGRLVTNLQPATNGPTIPTAAFTPAYDGVSGRVSADVEK